LVHIFSAKSGYLFDSLRYKQPCCCSLFLKIPQTKLKNRDKKSEKSAPAAENLDALAETCGFNSLSTFRRAFIKATGKTLLQYKKNKNQGQRI